MFYDYQSMPANVLCYANKHTNKWKLYKTMSIPKLIEICMCIFVLEHVDAFNLHDSLHIRITERRNDTVKSDTHTYTHTLTYTYKYPYISMNACRTLGCSQGLKDNSLSSKKQYFKCNWK